MSELSWFVAHTKPRCEKKLHLYCERFELNSTLPCVRAVHRYRGKTVTFLKPLFPGYVFVHIADWQRLRVYQSDAVARLLSVNDQSLFAAQLDNILRALDTDLEIRLVPHIGEGSQVKIKSGPLRGMDGWVEKRFGVSTVLLRLDFIGQAASVKVDATDLELI